MDTASLIEFAGRALGRPYEMAAALAGGGSERRYFRLRHGGDSVVGVISGDAAETRAFLAFTRHFAARGIPVPAILGEDTARGLYLLEDLGDETLARRLAAWRAQPDGRGRAMAALEQVLRWLPRIQVKGGAGLDYSLCPEGPELGVRTFHADVGVFLAHYIARHAPAAAPTAVQREALDTVIERASALDCAHFCYRDFQTRNIMWRGTGPVFLDYQSGLRGPLAYDLASILYSPDSGLEPTEREALTGVYLDALAEQGVTLEREEFLRGFYALVLLRRLQALGAYARIAREKNAPAYLERIPPALATLRELIAAGNLNYGLPALDEWLRVLLDSE